MTLSPQEAIIHLMIIAASSDTAISPKEYSRIETLVAQMPVFAGFDQNQLEAVANACVDAINSGGDIESAIATAITALPKRLQDTAYALAIEVTTADLKLEQEELRFLEMIRDQLDLDRLVTAAIETAARARYRGA